MSDNSDGVSVTFVITGKWSMWIKDCTGWPLQRRGRVLSSSCCLGFRVRQIVAHGCKELSQVVHTMFFCVQGLYPLQRRLRCRCLDSPNEDACEDCTSTAYLIQMLYVSRCCRRLQARCSRRTLSKHTPVQVNQNKDNVCGIIKTCCRLLHEGKLTTKELCEIIDTLWLDIRHRMN